MSLPLRVTEIPPGADFARNRRRRDRRAIRELIGESQTRVWGSLVW